MNKNDIYKLIGYHGEYNASVKKAIRKLLKENHPDHKGNRAYFELINEVKNELENGKVSYKEKDTLKVNKDIDYNYCNKMINELNLKKNSLNKVFNAKRELLETYENEYKDLYQKSLDMENSLLVNSPDVKEMQKFKILSLVLLALMLIAFIVSIINNSNFLVIFIVLGIICIYFTQKYLSLANKITESSKKRLASYVKMNDDIKNNIKKQNAIQKELRDIKRKIINVENDLRFYKNLLK